MSAKVTKNFGPLGDQPLSGSALMREVGDLATRLIRTRTEKGISSKGTAFRPLSPAYAKAKQKALGHSRPNLTVSGRMLNDMGVTATTESTVELGFRSAGGKAVGSTFIQRSRSVGAADKAYYHDQVGAGRSRVKREFFDLTEAEVDQIQQQVEAYLDRTLS